MKIKQFEIPGLAQYAFVVSSAGEAVVIDPMRDYERYLRYAAEEGLSVRFVTETHIHADFASGAAPLATAAGAELLLSGHEQGETYSYTMPHRSLHEREEFHVGKVRIQVLHTPGHTPEHLSFVAYDEDRDSTQPTALFSGDFLFVGGTGRPDLLGEGEKLRLAQDLYRSLHERIASLPDGVIVYPGHGAGSLCGAGIGARPETTLGYERATQPLFALDRDAFVKQVLASVPPMPSYYPRMKALNSAGATDYKALPTLRSLSPAEVQQNRNHSALILDLRCPEAFGGAHVPGSLNIGAGRNLSLWAGWLLEPDRDIVLIGDSEDASVALARVGLDDVSGHLSGGFPAWIEQGLPIEKTAHISPNQLSGNSDGQQVVDVRSQGEWDGGHIQGALHTPLGELPQILHTLPKSSPLVTVCGSGYRSSIAASLLQMQGFEQVSSMAGGMAAWRAQQLPLTKD